MNSMQAGLFFSFYSEIDFFFFIERICLCEENDSQVFLTSKWHYFPLPRVVFYSSALKAGHRKQNRNLRGYWEDKNLPFPSQQASEPGDGNIILRNRQRCWLVPLCKL